MEYKVVKHKHYKGRILPVNDVILEVKIKEKVK